MSDQYGKITDESDQAVKRQVERRHHPIAPGPLTFLLFPYISHRIKQDGV